MAQDGVVFDDIDELSPKLRDGADENDAHEGDVASPIGLLRNDGARVFPCCSEDLLLDPSWEVNIPQIVCDISRIVAVLLDNHVAILTDPSFVNILKCSERCVNWGLILSSADAIHLRSSAPISYVRLSRRTIERQHTTSTVDIVPGGRLN